MEEAANSGPSFKVVRVMHEFESGEQPTMKGTIQMSAKMFQETD
jgi:hypothetical protein